MSYGTVDAAPMERLVRSLNNDLKQAKAERDAAHKVIGGLRNDLRNLVHDLRQQASTRHLGTGFFTELRDVADRLLAVLTAVPDLACDHCHDDPPKSHVCPRCGRPAANLSEQSVAT